MAATCEILPEDVWRRIFALLNQKDLRISATSVCKSWFNIIRNDVKLSGVLTIGSQDCKQLSPETLSALLERWPKLKTLRFHCFQCFLHSFSRVCYEKCPLLDKVVFLHSRRRWFYNQYLIRCHEICMNVFKEGRRRLDFENFELEGYPLKMEILIQLLPDQSPDILSVQLRSFEEYCENKLAHLESLLVDILPSYLINEEMRESLRKFYQIALKHAYNLKTLEAWHHDSDFIAKTAAQRSALRDTNVCCPNLEEITFRNDGEESEEEVEEDFLEHILRFPKLKRLSLEGFSSLYIPYPAQFRSVTILKLKDITVYESYQIPKAFPNVREIEVHYEYIEHKPVQYEAVIVDKDICGFLELIPILYQIKNLRYFKWEISTTTGDVQKWMKYWWNAFEETGHQIINGLRKLHSDCFANIELKMCHDDDDTYQILSAFVKRKGGQPFWVKHRMTEAQSWESDRRETEKFDSTILCLGEPGCQCKRIMYDIDPEELNVVWVPPANE